MKPLRRLCVALALTLALTPSTYAGHIPCGITDASLAPTQQAMTVGQIETGITGEMTTGVTGHVSTGYAGEMPTGVTATDPATDILLNLLQSLLSLF